MSFDPEKVTFFARTDARGQNMPFGIKAKDRQRHVYVIGKTGMGKSTMLENMAVQDIQNGEGMAFIDPHGSAAETLLNYIPEHRVNDVLYFAPFDMEYPVSFNIMEDVGPEKRHLVVSGLMSVFEKIWVDAWSARMAYILQNTLMALLEYPDSTLLGVNRMLSDKAYRELVVENVKDPGVRSFWVDEFAKYNERYMQEAGDAIKNKIGQFTANPVIRNIIGQPKSSFDIRKMMDERKIIIMNLSKGLIGETNANLLGSMLTTRIYLAAMSRADLSLQMMKTMPNFYFFVDEFQSFANSTFASILSEARKYHLNLTIAHQYITQMEEEVRDAVFGNVGTIVSFRVGPLDAELLETIFAPQFTATDVVNLSFAQVYLTLMIDGVGSQPFSATTLPPIEPPTISYQDMVIASSREQYAHGRAEVEVAIQKFHEPIAPRAKPNQKPRRSDQETNNRPRSPVGERNSVERSTVRPDRTGGARQEGSQPQREPKSETRRERPAKDLSELRSVLKNISAENGTEKPAGKQEERNRPHEKQDKKPDPKQELKSVLAGVLKPKEGTSQASLASVAPQASVERPAPVASPAASPAGAEEAASAAHPTPARPPAATENHSNGGANGNSISPKELERMMRITTNDKPPLR